ncbi:MAG: hypothetical protein J2P36_23085, partial [Ktedonobacteraceae bacterium]|nr:hypothetical protein [Ktedonobacteraceae bacterium]
RAIREQFEETNMAVTALTVTVGSQGQDIRVMKEDIRGILDRLDGVDVRFDGVDRRLDKIEEGHASSS